MGRIPISEHHDLLAVLESGYTLPATWYTEPAVLEAERRSIFARSWQYAGFREQLQNPGDFFTYRAGKIPVVVVSDASGELRAFVNVCRHRGSELVLAEHGNRKSIQCHYHAWTYNLDGSLCAAPGSKLEPDFCKADFSLIPVQVDTWGPFVFVNPDHSGPPLQEVLGELPELIAATGIRLDGLHRRARHEYDIAANWKVVVDNYLECYHCPVAHPGFSDLIDVHDYQIRAYEYFSTQTGSVSEAARTGRKNVYTIGAGVDEGFYAFLWPNFMINIYPGPGNVSLNLILPLGGERTTAVYEYCFVESVGTQEETEFTAFIDQVQREDIVLCESVQRGLSSGCFEHGKLMLSRERALQHFQMLVYRSLMEGSREGGILGESLGGMQRETRTESERSAS